MKYFGFIKEHHDDAFATSIKELLIENNGKNNNLNIVIEYLKRGHLCVPLMGAVDNAAIPTFYNDDAEDTEFMGYMAVYTDGEWFWPDYIINYLEKYPTIIIDTDFINHVISNKDRKINIAEKELVKLEKEFLKESGFN